MTAIEEITSRLEEFTRAGLLTDFEVMVVDDSIRLRIVAPKATDAAGVKAFVVEAFAGLLSDSQISVDEAPPG